MKRIATIAASVSFLAGSCVPSPPYTISTNQVSETNDRPSELLETATSPAIATFTPPPPMPSKSTNTTITVPPTSTTLAIPELVALDCSPAFHLMKLGGSNTPQRPTDLAVHEQICLHLEPRRPMANGCIGSQ